MHDIIAFRISESGTGLVTLTGQSGHCASKTVLSQAWMWTRPARRLKGCRIEMDAPHRINFQGNAIAMTKV